MTRQHYDHLARVYQGLEYAAFGHGLERARVRHLGAMARARNVLVLGEGDGRFLEQLLARNPRCRVDVVENSLGMLDAIRRRMGKVAPDRVHLIRADARTFRLSEGAYDAVVSHFFFDVLEPEEVRALVSRAARSLVPGGLWALADFYVPAGGLGRARSRLWLGLLYWFFGWQAGVTTRELLDATPLLEAEGMVLKKEAFLRARLLRSQLFVKAGAGG